MKINDVEVELAECVVAVDRSHILFLGIKYVPAATPTLPQRMRDGAETIKEFNALCGMGVNCSISPQYMLREADRMDGGGDQ